jgi:hypothetical protein
MTPNLTGVTEPLTAIFILPKSMNDPAVYAKSIGASSVIILPDIPTIKNPENLIVTGSNITNLSPTNIPVAEVTVTDLSYRVEEIASVVPFLLFINGCIIISVV